MRCSERWERTSGEDWVGGDLNVEISIHAQDILLKAAESVKITVNCKVLEALEPVL